MGQGRRDKLCDPRAVLLCILLGAVCQIGSVLLINLSHPFGLAPIVKDKKKSAS